MLKVYFLKSKYCHCVLSTCVNVVLFSNWNVSMWILIITLAQTNTESFRNSLYLSFPLHFWVMDRLKSLCSEHYVFIIPDVYLFFQSYFCLICTYFVNSIRYQEMITTFSQCVKSSCVETIVNPSLHVHSFPLLVSYYLVFAHQDNQSPR